MNPRTSGLLALAVLLLGLSAALGWRSCSRPRINLDPYHALGTIAAEETARLCGGSGRIVVVIPDPGADPDPVLEAQLAAFRKSLARSGGATLKATETVTMDPLQRMQTGGAIPPGVFATIRAKHPDAQAFVLFLGVLPGWEAESGPAAGVRPKLVVLSAALPGYEALLRQGVLDLAIVPRAVTVDGPESATTSVRAVFDREYLVLRAGSAGGPDDP